ncbi:MAG: hypothetical protein NVS4B11_29160 [Ktedonobacteraceae bacterium]
MRSTDQPATQPKDVPQPASYSKMRTRILSSVFVLGAGLAASLVAVCVMSILRVAAGIPTAVELFSYFVLKHITAAKFVDLQVAFSPNSKTVPLGLAMLGMIGAGTVLSLLYAPLVHLRLPADGYRPKRQEWLVALAFAVVLTLIASILFQEELRQNQFGLPILSSTLLAILGLFVDFVAYAVVLCLGYRAILPKQAAAGNPATGRRLLLSRASVAVLGVGAGAGTLGAIGQFLKGYTSYDGMRTPSPQNVTSPITPNDQHYVVTQNTVDPTVNPDVWQLEVTGLIHNPGTYSYDALQKLPSTSRAITLECISNEVGAHLMSTAVWQGVTLQTLLEQRGGKTDAAKYVAFYSVDGYTTSLPLAEVLEADALLAWRMNGEILPQRHGFPLRVLIPGRFGEENPKWLTRVELTDHFVGGLYADQHWYNGPLHLTSRIDRPVGKIAVGHAVEVGGIAFGGSLGIQKVEVSTDKGLTWNAVTLQPPLSKDAWVLWTWQWTPAASGEYTLVVRATNGKGELQEEKKQGTVPGGAKGYYMVQVQAV